MRRLTIYSDGASKGNPGDAGIGIVISSEDGTVLREIAQYIGETTNNVAEYTALIRAVREAAEMGADSVEICTDSQLLAMQVTGIYKVKSSRLKPLHEELMSLLRGFPRVSIAHVSRELNTRADQLANEAVKKHRNQIEPRTSTAQPPRKPESPQRELDL